MRLNKIVSSHRMRLISWLSAGLALGGGGMLQGCWQSPPPPEDLKAACETLPPIISGLKPLYALDTDGDGIVLLDVDERTKDSYFVTIINPVTDTLVSEIGYMNIKGWKYRLDVVDIKVNQPENYKKNTNTNLRPITDVVYTADGYVGRGINLVYEYQGFAAPGSADCVHNFPVRVQLIKEDR